MALGFGTNVPQTGGAGGFPATGGAVSNRETPTEARTRITAEDRAEQARLNDPYGQQPDRTGQTITRRVRVRRPRVQSQNTQANNNNGAGNAKAGRGGPAGNASSYHMLNNRLNGQSSLSRASVLFQNQRSGQTGQANGNVSQRGQLLNGLGKYIGLDHSCRSLNANDKASTYGLSALNKLGECTRNMLTNHIAAFIPPDKKDKKDSKTNDSGSRMTPEALGRGKGLLRRLAAMSEPNPRFPDNLPADYQPYEGVA